jgi:hypothetical protein
MHRIERSMASTSIMKLSLYLLSVSATAAQGCNVVQSNDDGWAEINIRQQYESLTSAGFDSIISAPAIDRSGTGSSDAPPTTVGSSGCEFGSCPGGSPPIGNNASMPRLNVSHASKSTITACSRSMTGPDVNLTVRQFIPSDGHSIWHSEPV